MKLRIMSDVHLEFGPLNLEPIGEDLLVLAGDIGVGTQGAEWASEYHRWTGVPSLMIAGNHEFYNGSIRETTTLLSQKLEGVTFLDNDCFEVNDVLFIGSTLWTDFELNCSAKIGMILAEQSMNDYHRIRKTDATDILSEHRMAKRFIRSSTRGNSKKKIVIITHHAPSARSINMSLFGDDPLNHCYASAMDNVVGQSGAVLWIHGHTHASADYMIGRTRVLCNPRGYWQFELNPDFDPSLVVEV
jgi:predicted phosphohydrolase